MLAGGVECEGVGTTGGDALEFDGDAALGVGVRLGDGAVIGEELGDELGDELGRGLAVGLGEGAIYAGSTVNLTTVRSTYESRCTTWYTSS